MSTETLLRLDPTLVSGVAGWEPDSTLKLGTVDNPFPNGTVGAIGRAAQVSGPERFELTTLIQPYAPSSLAGLDPDTVRFFKWDEKSKRWQKVWSSGINRHGGFMWAKITSPGTYIPIALPEDPLLRESLFRLARQRRMVNGTL